MIQQQNVNSVLIVTDKGIVAAQLMNEFLTDLNEASIEAIIYDRTVPNPTIENIEEALRLYHSHACQAIIAFGGGSPIDCAKGVGARVARPDKSISDMKGLQRLSKSP